MMFGYIYKTTNTINGKIYIGKHKSKEIDANYIGSGKLLQYAINKYGKQNFICELLEVCNSLEELNNKEIYWIDYYNSRDKSIGYNILCGDDGGCSPGRVLSDEHKKRIGESNKGKKISDKQKEIISKCHKGIALSDEHRRKIGDGNKGKIISQAQREKLRQANLGKNLTESTKKKISDTLKLTGKERAEKRKQTIAERYPDGFKQSEDSNRKRSASMIGVHKSEETKQKMRKPKSPEHIEHMREARQLLKDAKQMGMTYKEYLEFMNS